MPYDRIEGESLKQYKLRLCQNKDEYGLSYPRIAEIINEEFDTDYAPSTIRTWFKAYSEGYDDRLLEQAAKENVLEEFESKLIELDVEKKKKQTAAIEYNKIIREEARRRMIVDEIRSSIGRVDVPNFHPLPAIPRNERAYVLGISDIHYGKIFESVNNQYSEETFRQRMAILMSNVIETCSKEQVSRLTIINLGDSVEGMALRISQLQHLEMGFMDMVIRFSRFMVQWLSELSAYVEIDYHHVPSANHTEIRPLGTKAGQFPREDVERVIQAYIHDMLSDNPRITVNEYTRDYARFNLFNFICYAKHGHQVRNIKTYMRDLSMLHREFIDYLFIGHYHHEEIITVGEGSYGDSQVLMLPSIMGSDEYSDSIGTGARAGARMFVFEEGIGKRSTFDFILS